MIKGRVYRSPSTGGIHLEVTASNVENISVGADLYIADSYDKLEEALATNPRWVNATLTLTVEDDDS